MFEGYPTYDRYRALHYVERELQVGEDIFALQTALNYYGYNLSLDGVFGKQTESAVKKVQDYFKLLADGIAGSATQEKLARTIGRDYSGDYGVAQGLVRGALSHESSFILGNYSVQRPNGSFDAGVIQRNSDFHALREAFNVPSSIDLWTSTVKEAYDKYDGVEDERKRWGYAAGSWNAPAYANWFAGVRPWAEPGPTAKALWLDYVDSVTAYLRV